MRRMENRERMESIGLMKLMVVMKVVERMGHRY